MFIIFRIWTMSSATETFRQVSFPSFPRVNSCPRKYCWRSLKTARVSCKRIIWFGLWAYLSSLCVRVLAMLLSAVVSLPSRWRLKKSGGNCSTISQAESVYMLIPLGNATIFSVMQIKNLYRMTHGRAGSLVQMTDSRGSSSTGATFSHLFRVL